MKRILSIDGGGIRGIIPVCALIELERQTGKLTRDLVDMVAGTSTGALIAAAVAVGVPATEILKVYTERTDEIFAGTWATAKMYSAGFRYHPADIHKVMRSVFGQRSGWTLNDSPIRILITAMGVNKHPWYFVQDNPKNAGTTGKLTLADCATASSAAPTYFSPWYVPPMGGTLVGWCFDGGVGVTGNPVYQACVEAFCYDNFSPEDTRVVSLGTGYVVSSQVNPPSGFLATLEWTIDTLLGSPHDEQTQIVNRHYPGILKRHDWLLPKPIDMADTDSIPTLVEIGRDNATAFDWKSFIEEPIDAVLLR